MSAPAATGTPTRPLSLALATAFAVALGFLPKDTLVFYVVLAASLLGGCPVLILAGGGLACHLLGWYCTPLFHKLGAILLTEPRLVELWRQLAETPVLPWTRFHNTVVMGAGLASLLLFWPVFLFSLPFFGRVLPGWRSRLENSALYRWAVPSPWSQEGTR